MEKKYSVGIPARNEQNTIKYTLDSVLGQTVPPEKVTVCVNGCDADDKTYQIVSDFSKYEPTVEAITSSPGKPNAWNKIVENNYNNKIMFCDGDVGVDKHSAESFLEQMAKDDNLVLIGGFRKQRELENRNSFVKYFTENSNVEILNQSFVAGALYMIKIGEYKRIAESIGVEPMPANIINEDKYLELVANGHNKMTDAANFSFNPISSFSDWLKGSRRIIAGDLQLEREYTDLMHQRFPGVNLKEYFERFKKIDSLANKAGIASLFALRQVMKVYYKFNDTLDYKTTWDETKSTKIAFGESR